MSITISFQKQRWFSPLFKEVREKRLSIAGVNKKIKKNRQGGEGGISALLGQEEKTFFNNLFLDTE